MPDPVTSHYLRRIISELKERGVDFKPEDNDLNKFDRYAYHLQLFMVNDRDAVDPDIQAKVENNQIRKIIIAESGVTAGFNIVDCELSDAVGHNFRNRNTHSVKVDFTIAEPYSMSLPDKLYIASVQLAILNWRLAPIFLKLYFDYYDAEGRIVPDRRKRGFYYRLKIVDFDNTLTAAGTIYKLSCVVDNDIGFRNNYFIIPQTYTIKVGGTPSTVQGSNLPLQNPAAPGTVFEFFRKLEDEINKFYAKQRQGPAGPLPAYGASDPRAEAQGAQVVFYEFNVEDKLAEQKIKFTPNVNNRRASFSQPAGGEVEITVGHGISIGAIVDDICASITDPLFFIPNDQTGRIKVPWIECVVEEIGWDDLLNDYIRRFRFFINVKETRRPVPNLPFGRTFQASEEFQNARLQSIADGGTLRKAYLYFYTGLNTEIINLDVKFSHLHYIPQPLTNATVLPDVFSAPRASLPSVQVALGQRLSMQSRIQALQAELARPGGVPAARSAAISDELAALLAQDNFYATIIAERSLVIFDPNLASQIQSRTEIDLGQSSAPIQSRRDELLISRQAAQVRRARLEFVEDVSTQQQNVQPSALTYISDPRDLVNLVRPVNGDSQSRKQYASITSQLYDKRGDMVNITMEIKGDPYWLGKPNIERNNDLLRSLPNSGAPVPNQTLGQRFALAPNADDISGVFDAFFILAFRHGTLPNEQTGFMDLRDDVDFFNALYLVVNVTHIFRDGKFTQRIEATRDALSTFGGTRPQPEPQQSLPG
jgi:hypothetical protein